MFEVSSTRTRLPARVVLCVTVVAAGALGAVGDAQVASSGGDDQAAAASEREAAGGSIRLRRVAKISDAKVRLSDVAVLEGGAAAVGGLVIGQLADGDDATTVTLAAVRKLLEKRQVEIVGLTVGGYMKTKVTRVREAASEDAEPTHVPVGVLPPAGPVVANSIDPIALNLPRTLRQRLADAIVQLSGMPRRQISIKLSPVDARILDVAAEAGRYEFRARGKSWLGKLAITIHHYDQHDRRIGTYHVRPHITRQMSAVVVRQHLRPGDLITRDNVAVKLVQIDKEQGVPVAKLTEALGMTARSALRPNAVLCHTHLRQPLLVRKGQTIDVRCFTDGVIVAMKARALEDGRLDDVVKVRNERAVRQRGGRRGRQVDGDPVFYVRVTGRQQAAVGTPGSINLNKDERSEDES